VRTLTATRLDGPNQMKATMLVGTAVAWAGLCAMSIRMVALGYGYPTTWLATANAWIALMTLPALIAFGMGGSDQRRTKWFFWLGLSLAPFQASALIFAVART
jgi:hypothetical protein